MGTFGSGVERRSAVRLVVHGHNVEITPDLYSHVERRVLSALRRFGRRVRRMTVRLHAGTGDAMTSCHILLELHPSGGLGIGEAGPDLETVIDRAAEGAGGALGRELGRRSALPQGHGRSSACPME